MSIDRITNAAKGMIISVDGEGNDITHPESGVTRHAYTLLAAADDKYGFERHVEADGILRMGDAKHAPNFGLTTRQCLDFLVNLPRGQNVIVVSFAFSYDVTKILTDLPVESLTELHKTGETVWEGYRISHMPRKYFKVTYLPAGKKLFRCSEKQRYIDAKHVTVWDVFTFFQQSFVNALRSARAGLFDKEIVDEIADMKAKRSQFENESAEDILRYCYRECRYLSVLVRDLLTNFERAGLPLTRYHGPGAVASEWYRKQRIKNYIGTAGLPDDPYAPEPGVWIGHSAYYGGRFEICQTGYVGDLYAYDINSAYPHIMSSLPCLAHAEFRRTDHFEPGKVGVYYVGSRTEGRWAPFPLRVGKALAKQSSDAAKERGEGRIRVDEETGCESGHYINSLSPGTVVYAHGGRRWVWQDELAIAVKHFGPDAIPVYDGYVLEQRCSHRPFADVPEMYARRKKLKAAKDGAEKALKLLINSLYGKTAQSIGWRYRENSPYGPDDPRSYEPPPYQSYIWAGLITSGCRAMVLDAMMTGDVLSVATDGILSKTRIDSLPCSTSLGDWEFEEYRDVWLFQSGIYTYKEPVRDKATGKPLEWKTKFKSRGFAQRDLPVEEFKRAWTAGEWEVASNPYHPTENPDGCRGFMPYSQGISRTNPLDVIGEWLPYRKTVTFHPSKRLGVYYSPGNPEDPESFFPDRETGSKVLDSVAYVVSDEEISDPYRPRQTWEDVYRQRAVPEDDEIDLIEDPSLVIVEHPLKEKTL